MRLLALGIDPRLAPLDAPSELRALHMADARAGAQCITAATFAVTDPKALKAAVAIARDAALPVWASMGPVKLESLRQRALLCLEAGADAIVLETFTDRQVLIDTAQSLADLPVIASFCPLSGSTMDPSSLFDVGVQAAGLGCGDDEEALLAMSLRWAEDGAAVVYRPSAGLPGPDGQYPLQPEAFARLASAAWAGGVAAVGICCGGTAEHLSAARDMI